MDDDAHGILILGCHPATEEEIRRTCVGLGHPVHVISAGNCTCSGKSEIRGPIAAPLFTSDFLRKLGLVILVENSPLTFQAVPIIGATDRNLHFLAPTSWPEFLSDQREDGSLRSEANDDVTHRWLILPRPWEAPSLSAAIQVLTAATSSSRSVSLASPHRIGRDTGCRNQIRRISQRLRKVHLSQINWLGRVTEGLRTPLRHVVQSVENFLADDFPGYLFEDQRRALNEMGERSRETLNVVEGLADLCRLQQGGLPLHRQSASCTEFVDRLVHGLRIDADAKGVKLVSIVSPHIPAFVEIDVERLWRILHFGLQLAIASTRSGRVVLESEYRTRSQREHLVFRISTSDSMLDSKHGSAQKAVTAPTAETVAAEAPAAEQKEDDIRSICSRHSPFLSEFKFAPINLQEFGLEWGRRLTQSMGGDLTYQIDAAHRGRIQVIIPTVTIESEDHVVASRGTDRAVEFDDVDAPHRDSKSEETSLLGNRILVADDDGFFRQALSKTLRGRGADVDLAEDGQGAYGLAVRSMHSGRPYDLILMDVHMPLLDGFEATTLLRIEGYSGPVVALASHSMEGDVTRCLQVGCSHRWTKSLNEAELVSLCLDWLNFDASRWAESSNAWTSLA